MERGSETLSQLKNGKILKLRQAQRKDAEQMLAYLNQIGGESDNLLFGENSFNISLEQEEMFIEDHGVSDQKIMLLGFIENELVSISNLSVGHRQRIQHNGEVSISVKKAYWGFGIGRAAMAYLIDYARSGSVIKNIHLGVKKANVNARALYTQLGFKECGCYSDFFCIDGVYDDEILMALKL